MEKMRVIRRGTLKFDFENKWNSVAIVLEELLDVSSELRCKILEYAQESTLSTLGITLREEDVKTAHSKLGYPSKKFTYDELLTIECAISGVLEYCYVTANTTDLKEFRIDYSLAHQLIYINSKIRRALLIDFARLLALAQYFLS